jgi:hypothetical protein
MKWQPTVGCQQAMNPKVIGTATTGVPKVLVLLAHRNGLECNLTFERPRV